jgi:hypothetical protein
MDFLGSYQQPMMGQPMMGQQGSSMFGSFFGAGGKINPQSIQTIQMQLSQQGIPPNKIASIIEALTKMQYDKDEQVNTILSNTLGRELANQVQLLTELEDIEDGPNNGMNRQRMPPRSMQGMPSRSMQGMSRRGNMYDNGAYGGKRRRRTRRRMQRGGYSMSTFSNDAAPITGGRRRRRRTHKKRGKRSSRR